MKTIPVGKYIALVDDQDYEILKGYSWRPVAGINTMYACTNIKDQDGKYKTYGMHRMILGLTDSNILADHKDLNGLNNQRYNLRVADHSQNCNNKSLAPDNKTGYKGVSHYYLDKNRFVAQVKKDKKSYYLGIFNTKEEAAIAYDLKAKELFGEFAYLNFP